MAKYLLEGSYTSEGAKGLIKEGGSQRRAAVEKTLQALGARIEAFYYSLGDADVYVIVDAPDNVTVAALSMAVNAAAAVRLKTTVLMTVEDMDAAAKKSVKYRAPGR
jgi:uncharacterized protein with GYD domain